MSIATPPACSQALVEDKSLGYMLYGLMSAFPLFFIPVLVSLWLNLIQKNVQPNSLLGSHLRWQKFSIIGLALAVLMGYLSAGMWFSLPILLTGIVWFCYRVFKGWLSLNDGIRL
ncbi:hypothetical protein G3R49_10385 [Shewanella sp. WXL01]|uniref:DUF4870 domain-containing protein n=1 Tax=Shewanella maritima TaxID=2520507 RepID=A0A411PKA5_9GAMM|nr:MULTISPECIES: hypothetical protein [Shewanella]NKF50969.1 hypothetical protein [Shewanella sp. WXL01]QBF83934.1 hypothetical protein EXU30_15530 [Shewanella maritima]